MADLGDAAMAVAALTRCFEPGCIRVPLRMLCWRCMEKVLSVACWNKLDLLCCGGKSAVCISSLQSPSAAACQTNTVCCRSVDEPSSWAGLPAKTLPRRVETVAAKQCQHCFIHSGLPTTQHVVDPLAQWKVVLAHHQQVLCSDVQLASTWLLHQSLR